MRRFILVLTIALALGSAPTRAEVWVDILNESFSTDPFLDGWQTNRSDRFYWNPADQCLVTDNYTNSGDWATIRVPYHGESFEFRFRCRPTRNPGDNGDVNVGLLPATRITNSGNPQERVYLLFGGYLGQIYVEGTNAGGEDFWSGPGSGLLALGQWHDVCVTYDATAKTLAVEVTVEGTPVLRWQTIMSFGFSSNLEYFGVSMVGNWATSDRHEYACIDDVVFSIGEMPQPVLVDIKPGSCPNPFNITGRDATDVVITFDDGRVIGESGETFKMSPGGAQSKAVIPVAILGTPDFDVMDIDPATLMLGGVPLLRYAIEDVSTPTAVGAGECECNTLGPDGFQDLTIKFDKAALIAAIGSVAEGDVVTLTLTGVLRDGTPIEGQDCVVIHAPGLSSVFPPLDPTQAGLAPNYPNPFNPSTTIRFYLPQAAPYELTIRNILGQTVRSFAGAAPAGVNAINWDGRDHSGSPVASGTYLYRLTSGDFEATRQMSLLK